MVAGLALAAATMAVGVVGVAVVWRAEQRDAARLRRIEFVAADRPFTALRTDDPNGAFRVRIVDGVTGEELAVSTASVSPRLRWDIIEDRGNIWVDSSDIGVFFFTLGESGWEEHWWTPGTEIARRFPAPAGVRVR